MNTTQCKDAGDNENFSASSLRHNHRDMLHSDIKSWIRIFFVGSFLTFP